MKKKTLQSGLFPVKVCIKCGETKLAVLAYFSYHSRNSDHLNNYCKECINSRNAEYRKNNREKIHIYQKKYNKLNKEKIKEWHKNNPEKVKIFVKRTCEKNREKRRARSRKYKQECQRNNPEGMRDKLIKYLNSYANFSTYAPKLTIEEDPIDDGSGSLLAKCAYCGKYFYPTTSQVKQRVGSLVGSNCGESRLYCSDGCKTACPIFNQIS